MRRLGGGGASMEDGLYTVRVVYTKVSPPEVYAVIPRIGRRKLLEKLKHAYGVEEKDLEKCENGYFVWPEKDLYIEIIRRA